MKKILLILSFLLLSQISASAQEIAVMKVSVNVVSGAKAEQISDLFISANSNESLSGQLIITSSPNSEIQVQTDSDCTLVNESGEIITVQTNSLLNLDNNTGAHHLSLNGKLPKEALASGNFKGNLVTTIVYL
ncbi:MAG: hypothetical protein ABJH08_05435 [Balneola sp.]